jgi:hypothetical protein
MTARAPTSAVLDGLLGPEAPGQVTLGWLMGRLGDRSFGLVLLLGASLLAPVPLSNVPPALATGLIAFAYLEEDGLLLGVALAAALAMLAVAAVAAWEALGATGWVPGLL